MLRTLTIFFLLTLALAACSAPPNGEDASAPASDGIPPSIAPAPSSGGSSSEAPDIGVLPDGTPTACDLLTVDEVASVLDHAVTADGEDTGFCLWSDSDAEAGQFASVSLAPLSQEECIDVHAALGATEIYEYEDADFGVPAFAGYRETMAGTHIATFEVCTARVHLGVRVEGSEADEAGHQAMAAALVEVALDRLDATIGI